MGVSAYQPVPIEAAKRIAEEFAKNQVAIWTYDNAHRTQHVTTWGGPALGDSLRAAEAGNAIKRAAQWADPDCHALPESLADLFDRWDAAVSAEVAGGNFHKATALAVMTFFRDVARDRAPQLADQLIPTRTEAAQP